MQQWCSSRAHMQHAASAVRCPQSGCQGQVQPDLLFFYSLMFVPSLKRAPLCVFGVLAGGGLCRVLS